MRWVYQDRDRDRDRDRIGKGLGEACMRGGGEIYLGIVTGNPRVFGELPVPVPAGFSLKLLNNYDKVFNNNINYKKAFNNNINMSQ